MHPGDLCLLSVGLHVPRNKVYPRSNYYVGTMHGKGHSNLMSENFFFQRYALGRGRWVTGISYYILPVLRLAYHARLSCALPFMRLACHALCLSCPLPVMCLACHVPCLSCALSIMCACHAPCLSCALPVMRLVCHAPCLSCALSDM